MRGLIVAAVLLGGAAVEAKYYASGWIEKPFFLSENSLRDKLNDPWQRVTYFDEDPMAFSFDAGFTFSRFAFGFRLGWLIDRVEWEEWGDVSRRGTVNSTMLGGIARMAFLDAERFCFFGEGGMGISFSRDNIFYRDTFLDIDAGTWFELGIGVGYIIHEGEVPSLVTISVGIRSASSDARDLSAVAIRAGLIAGFPELRTE